MTNFNINSDLVAAYNEANDETFTVEELNADINDAVKAVIATVLNDAADAYFKQYCDYNEYNSFKEVFSDLAFTNAVVAGINDAAEALVK